MKPKSEYLPLPSKPLHEGGHGIKRFGGRYGGLQGSAADRVEKCSCAGTEIKEGTGAP